jgi:CubicO group peptidase (beta-lactamase class C family)
VGAIYIAAWLGKDYSTAARALIWMDADVDDHTRFAAREIGASRAPFMYERSPGYPFGLPITTAAGYPDLAVMLAANQTTAFIAIQDDKLLYEHYFNGYSRNSIQTSFSVAKSFNSAMLGRALADHLIGSIDDPITRYLPELQRRDPRFASIKIRHLVSMSSGLRYRESGTPWGDDAKTYYGPDLRHLALEETEIVEPPGQRFHYNNFNPLLMGLILERATGKHVADYLAESIWKPLGAEAGATWSLDSQWSGFEKMESGINGRAIDFAKLGSLYLHRGKWRGKQVLPAEWVDQSTRYTAETDPALKYQYGWWTFHREGLGDYYAAIGNKGQYVFVFPQQRLVIVRHGIERGSVDWATVISDIALAVNDDRGKP